MKTPTQLLAPVVICCGLACQSSDARLEKLGVSKERADQILREVAASGRKPVASSSKPPQRVAKTVVAPRQQSTVGPSRTPDTSETNWVVDELVDLAPAAPSTAHATGVLLVDGENRLWRAHLGKLSRIPSKTLSPVQPLPDNSVRFPMGRGPSVAGKYAYWVTSHYLLRRPVAPPHEPLEIIAEDARVGTRASALLTRQELREQTWVAYVALPSVKDGPLKAKLWHGTEEHLLLTPESSSALSVQLKSSGGEVLALALEARTGMTTLHARRVISGKKKPRLGEDQVVWVGGASQPLTELFAAPRGAGGFWGFLATERDITHFGLAVLELAAPEQGTPARVQWLNYPNGADPSPLDAAIVCGREVVLLARPSTTERGAPQELVLSELRDGQATPGVVLSTAKAFYDVSIVPIGKRGALISFVADYRTWARTIRCP